jgi:tetratricopeptide (TPR) repeat protein
MEFLGAFEVLDEISTGAFGRVHRARHRDGTPAAVKVLHHHDVGAFQREIRAIARLAHPHIVQIFDHGVLPRPSPLGPEGTPWFVMERCSAGPLSRLEGRRDWDWVRTLAGQLLSALAHAHARQVIHLDIKPANILFADGSDPRPGPKLVDFGIAFAHGGNDAASGTPTYMPPEQFDGRADVGPWTDLYALAMVIWTLVSGPPFARGPAGLLEKIEDRPARFEPVFPVPDGVEDWLRTLMVSDWRRRTLSAAAALQALEALDGQVTGSAALPIPPDEALTELAVVGSPQVELGGAPALLARLPTEVPRDTPHVPVALQGTGIALLGLRPPPFVGRTATRVQLWRHLHRSRRDGARVLLTGRVGAGKRRLMQWLGDAAHADGGAIAPPLAELDPTAPARDLVCRALFVQDGDPERVRSRLLAYGAWNARCEAAVTELFTGYDAEVAPALAIRILGALARRLPVVLALPEVDERSVWVRMSGALAEPILWVFSGPTHLEDAAVIEVQPLPADGMTTALREWLPFQPEAVDRLVRMANGSPGLLVEAVRNAVAHDAISAGSDGWSIALDADLAEPFDAPPAHRRVLGCVAWLGPWSTAARLERFVPDAAGSLSELLRSGILREVGNRLQFVDPRHRTTAEAWLDAPLLLEIGTTLLTLGDARRASRAFREAGDNERALRATVRDLDDHDRAHGAIRADLVRRALAEAAGRPLDEAVHGRLWIAQARCWWEADEPDTVERLTAMFERATALGWWEAAGVAAQFRRLASSDPLTTDLEIAAFERMAPGTARHHRLGVAHRDRSMLMNDPSGKRAALVLSLEHLEKSDRRYAYLYTLCERHVADGRIDEAVAVARDAIDFARAHRSDRLVNALVHLCSIELGAHRFEAAVGSAEAAAVRARMLGAGPALMIALGNQALALANLGRWERASQVASQALRYAGYPVFAATLRVLVAVQRARKGDWAAVEATVEEAETIGERFARMGWDARFSLGALITACATRPDLEGRLVDVLARLPDGPG